jgi:hypothetical protein
MRLSGPGSEELQTTWEMGGGLAVEWHSPVVAMEKHRKRLLKPGSALPRRASERRVAGAVHKETSVFAKGRSRRPHE